MVVRKCLVAALGLTLLSAGCTSLPRAPLTSQHANVIPDIPKARLTAPESQRLFQGRTSRTPLTILALSGGGADGAYGAGFLAGWTETGQRPDFDVVTGSSVGALIAPFAFLGPRYDFKLRQAMTTGLADDLLQIAGVDAIIGASVYESGPLRDLIARYADDALIDAVAARHHEGKRLIIATTNVDTQSTTLWNMGEIAASNSLQRRDLFRNVLAASAAIPGIFPPVLIEVRSGGQAFVEMHVDGGVSSNVTPVPEVLLTSSSRTVKARLFVIINGKLSNDPAYTMDHTLPIVVRSFQTAVKANTRNTMIATYGFCQRNGWEFNATAVDASIPTPRGVANFDQKYMEGLYAFGRAKGASGTGFEQSLENRQMFGF